MRTLQFSVDGQKLDKNGDISKIIRGTKGYLNCRFIFIGSDWIKCKAVAVFECKNKEYAVAIARDGSCAVPNEVTDEKIFKLKVIGMKDDYRITTNRVLIEQEG